MFATAFDLTIADTEVLHPKGQRSAYYEIGVVLRRYGFRWIQGSVYITDNEDLSVLTSAMVALRELPWFPGSVRDIRAFRVEQWSDFTAFFKERAR